MLTVLIVGMVIVVTVIVVVVVVYVVDEVIVVVFDVVGIVVISGRRSLKSKATKSLASKKRPEKPRKCEVILAKFQFHYGRETFPALKKL